MEIPPQSRPKHHCNLAGGGGMRKALRGRLICSRVGDGREEKVVIPQRRLPVRVYMVFARRRIAVVSCIRRRVVALIVILAIQNNSPARRKDRLVVV